MLGVQVWHAAVVIGVLTAGMGSMALAIARMFSRVAGDVAVERRATPFESALVGGELPLDHTAFDAFSYRVNARFAGKVRAVVGPDRVIVSGPRVPRGLYTAWIWLQGMLLAAVPALFAWSVFAMDWRLALVALGTLVASLGISSLGAGVWPGLGEMELLVGGAYKALELPLTSVSDVAVGEGWARGGMEVVLFPYKKGIDAMAADRAVSWFGPDEHGRLVRYALHLNEPEQAAAFAALLRGTPRGGVVAA